MEIFGGLTAVEIKKMAIMAVIAGVLELDAYFVGVMLLSQPIITGGIAGYIFGNLQAGILIGGIVQLIWANNPPVGAYVPPSANAIAVVTTVITISALPCVAPFDSKAFIMFALIWGAATGYFIGQADVWNRQFNTLLVHLFEERIKEGKERFLVLTQVLAVSVKLIRDIFLYMAVFVLGSMLAEKIYITLPAQIVTAMKLSFWAMPALGFAVVYDMYRTKQGEWIFGWIIGAALLLLIFYPGINHYFYLLCLITGAVFYVYNAVWNTGGKKQ